MTEEEDFAESMLLLDSIVPSELQDDDERTLLEEAVLTPLEEEDSFLSLEEEFAVAMLLLDSPLSLGVTGEEQLSSSQAARRSKLEIAKAIILFDFFKAT